MKNSLFKNLAWIMLLFFALFTPTIMFGQTPEETTPANIIEWLTPLVVLGATHVIRLVKPLIPGWATMLVVTLLSMAVAWITSLLSDTTEMSFIAQTLYGLLAVVINQFYRQFTGGNKKYARES